MSRFSVKQWVLAPDYYCSFRVNRRNSGGYIKTRWSQQIVPPRPVFQNAKLGNKQTTSLNVPPRDAAPGNAHFGKNFVDRCNSPNLEIIWQGYPVFGKNRFTVKC